METKIIYDAKCFIHKHWLLQIMGDKTFCQKWLPSEPTKRQVRHFVKEYNKTVERWEQQWEMYGK